MMKNLQYIAVAVISLIILVCTHALFVRGEEIVTSETGGAVDGTVESSGENTRENAVLQQETEVIVTESMQFAEASLPDEETLFAGYVNEQFEEEIISTPALSETERGSQGKKLEGPDAKAYQILRDKICDVAAGEETVTSWEITAEEIGIEPELYHEADLGVEILMDEVGTNNDEAARIVLERSELHIGAVFYALVADLPYELYWFDKTVGISSPQYHITYGTDENGEAYISSLEGFSIGFAVSKDYSSTGKTHTYETDQEKTKSASSAEKYAKELVDAKAGLSDFEKLDAYKDAICSSVSYYIDLKAEPDAEENDADETDDSSNDTIPYGDPWQLVWVFDGDETTNVVCEGYSKAFQYLCDLSSFDADIRCISVTGFTNAGVDLGGHMWNLVTIGEETADPESTPAGDGSAVVQESGYAEKTFLADITNSDSEAIGADGELFLSGYDGEEDSAVSYTIPCGNSQISYVYDEDTRNQYSPDALKLSETDYIPGRAAHDLHFFEAVPASCTENGTVAYWKCETCGKLYADENAVTRLRDEDLTDQAPGHDYKAFWDWKDNNQGGYTAEATFICSRCNDTQKVSIQEISKQETASETLYTAQTILDNTKYTAVLTVTKNSDETETGGSGSNGNSTAGSGTVNRGAGTGAGSGGSGPAGSQKQQLTRGTVCMTGGQEFQVTGAAGTSAGDRPGTVLFTKAKNKKNVTVPDRVVLSDGKTYNVVGVAAKAFTGKKIRKVTIGANVMRLAKNAFAKSRAKTIVLKTKLLGKTSVKGSLKKSKVTKIQVKTGKKKENKKMLKQYRKYFTKKNAGRSVTVC